MSPVIATVWPLGGTTIISPFLGFSPSPILSSIYFNPDFEVISTPIPPFNNLPIINKPNDDAASWVTYKVKQRAAKAKFLREVKKVFEDILQEDVEIIDKDGKKHFLINQSKL